MRNLRSQGEFTDAWVRVVHGDIVAAASAEPKPETSNPTTVSPPAPPVQLEPAEQPEASAEQPAASTEEKTVEEDPIVDNEEIVQHKQMTLGNTEVFLSLFYGTKNRVVDGEVQVIDTERSRFITKVKGNDYLVLPDPKTKSGQLTLTCDVFGYRKVQHELNYPLPLADTVKEHIKLMGTTIVVSFELIRYLKGDTQILYNVYFYNDAAIMLPESKYEVNSLLEMMKENPNYKIKLHGHSNGNYHGKIIGLGPDKNFFSMEGSTQSVGSANDLSGQRAGTIKAYLVANGIAEDRVDVKAWGGKKPLYDKHSANAKKNVRVEVEVVSE
jgi:outer membrane protein OmpA-like peptidoglycan-associated protein